MLEIIVSKEKGFCFGVQRALTIAYDVLKKGEGKPVYSLGELVHNPEVIRNLERDGVKSITEDQIEKLPPGVIIFRAHGVSPRIRKLAEENGFEIVDATCPRVERIHTIVKELKEQGYDIVIAGRADHPEVKGIAGEIDGKCTIMGKVKDTEDYPKSCKLGIVAQSTTSRQLFLEIASRLMEKAKETRVFDTVCRSTIDRQKYAKELAAEVDVMIVIGGKNSSNTKHLWEFCYQVNYNSYQVEYPNDLNRDWFEGAEKVGIATGASTPDGLIDAVAERIRSFSDK